MFHDDNKTVRSFSRRRFLQSGLASAGVAAGVSLGAHPRSAHASLANTPTSFLDYRALVCIRLRGGNDSLNMIVPSDEAGYADYAAARGPLALGLTELSPITPQTPPSGPYTSYGLHPSLSYLSSSFAAGSAAIIANVGALPEPISKVALEAGTAIVPEGLGDHVTQRQFIERLDPDEETGWAGRIDPNLTQAIQIAGQPQQFRVSVSLNESAQLSWGTFSEPFVVNERGPLLLAGLDPSNPGRLAAWNNLLTLAQTDTPMRQAVGARMELARDTRSSLDDALGAVPAFTTPFPDTSLGRQLEVVARFVGARATLGTTRNIFTVTHDGYDTHRDQLARHAALLTELDEALAAFSAALTQLSMTDNVVTFTTTEFGRSVTPTGTGTGQGWGAHQFVIGGCVAGGNIFGSGPMPSLDPAGPNIAARALIPTTPVDAMLATMARWLGVLGLAVGGTVVGGSEMDSAFPNLSGIGGAAGFPGPHDLGFLL